MGRLPLRDIPFDALKRGIQAYRKLQYDVVVPAEIHSTLLLGTSIDELRKQLARNHYATWNKLAYYYQHPVYGGEDLNVRRIENLDDEGDYWQSHIRAVDAGEKGVVVWPHYELCTIEHPRRHLEEEGYDVHRGIEIVLDLIEDTDITVEDDDV